LSYPAASLWGPAASSPSARRRRRSSSAAWWWKRRGEAATVGDFGGENGYMPRILEGNEINSGELPFLSRTLRARSPFRAFSFRPESPSTPRKAGDGLGSPDG
jgi:hypothetical protein